MEVMVAMMVFVIAALTLMGVFLSVSQIGESSRNLTQAMADARTVLEAIRNTSVSGLSEVTAVDWTTWAEDNGLTTLGDEAITVTYVDEAADPLEVTVQVDWRDRTRARSATINTLVTQR